MEKSQVKGRPLREEKKGSFTRIRIAVGERAEWPKGAKGTIAVQIDRLTSGQGTSN